MNINVLLPSYAKLEPWEQEKVVEHARRLDDIRRCDCEAVLRDKYARRHGHLPWAQMELEIAAVLEVRRTLDRGQIRGATTAVIFRTVQVNESCVADRRPRRPGPSPSAALSSSGWSEDLPF